VSQVIHVGIGVLVRHRGTKDCRVLITRRPDKAVLGGYWELPGGKFEPKESPPRCVVREFKEELGLDVAVEDALGVQDHRYDHGHVCLHAYYCRLVAGEPAALEVAEFRWVRPRDLTTYRFPPANTTLIRRLVEELGTDAES